MSKTSKQSKSVKTVWNIGGTRINIADPAPRVTKVQKLMAMCGVRMTALYLKKREYTLDQTLQLMFPSMTPAQRNRMNHIQAIDTI